MARHLCIVARDNSPLYGFLTIAFRERPAGADALDVVLDRRRGEIGREGDRPGSHTDRRRHARVAEALRTSGYAIVAGPGGTPRASDEALIERAVGILADVERRGPLALRFNQEAPVRRNIVRAAIGVLIVLALIWVLTTLPRIGGLARVTDEIGRWSDAVVGRLVEAWTALSGGTVSPPMARGPEDERARPPEPATSMAVTAPVPSPVQSERAAPIAASPRPAPVAESRVAPEPPRVAERSAPLASPRLSASRVPTAEPARPSPRETPARETLSREAALREPAPREAAPRESSETADTRALTAFNGLPRVELSRQPSISGNGIVYTVRLADTGGRAVPGAQVWMRGQTGDGHARETRLDAVDPPGTYRSAPLPLGTLPPQLSVRIFFSNMRVEVPVEP